MTLAYTPANPDQDDERTSAQGLFNFGDAYLASAHALWSSQVEVVFRDRPIRFMAYHAAELYLKAFLRAAGMSVDELRTRGHSFRRLIPSARRRGLKVDPECARVFRFGERTGDVIEARYIRTGFGRWVDTKDLGHCAAHIRKAVRLNPQRIGQIVLRGEGVGYVDDEWERAWGVL